MTLRYPILESIMRDIDGMLCVGAPNSPARAAQADRCCIDCSALHGIASVPLVLTGQCYICETPSVSLRIVGTERLISEIKMPKIVLREYEDCQVQTLGEDMNNFGQIRAILIRNDTVIDGVRRIKSLLQFGKTKVIVRQACGIY